MKVLLVNTFIGSTSTGNLTYEIYKMVVESGNECIIAYGRKNTKKCGDVYQIGNKKDYLLHCFWTRATDRNGFASRAATKKLVKFIDEYSPDVIHLHNLHGYYLNIPILFEYLTEKDIPIIWTFHDCWPYTGHCPYYSAIGCNRWQTECYSCPKQHQHPASYWLEQSSRNYADKKKYFTMPKNMVITPVSKWLGNEISKSFFRNKKIEVVYNGLDLDTFKPSRTSSFIEKYGLLNKKIILGVANIWTKNKGLEDFINLARVLPDIYKIVLVGLNSNQIKDVSHEGIIGISRTENIQQLVEIYSAADVFVNPSREETFGLVTAEALACGTPAVVYNATASPELVDEKTGCVVEVGDITALYQAIKSIDKQRMSKACVKRAEILFDKRKNQKKYLEIYEKMINRSKYYG